MLHQIKSMHFCQSVRVFEYNRAIYYRNTRLSRKSFTVFRNPGLKLKKLGKSLSFLLFIAQYNRLSALRFQMQYGVRAQTALPYAMNSEFSRTLASQMVHVCSIFQSVLGA